MRSEHPYRAIAAWCAGLLLLVPGLGAQESAAPGHVGYPQDWTDHSIVWSLDGLAKHPELLYREPRIARQLMQRFQIPDYTVIRDFDESAFGKLLPPPAISWPIALTRGKVAANMFPAKFSFNPGLQPDCTNDFVVFGLDVAGKVNGQANLIGINNLYAGTGGLCGANPTVLFAYNITTGTPSGGGIVSTSPIISEKGDKIAFVESQNTSCVFHVLTWSATGNTITTADDPGAAMVSITLSSTLKSTTASPWVDYFSDTAYVADDGGNVYQITGVFKGTPTLSGAPWPVPVSGGRLSPIVLDNFLNVLVIAARNGNLYQVSVASGTITETLAVGKGGTIVAPPIVDVTNGLSYIVSSNDGTSAVLDQVPTATFLNPTVARIGKGANGGGAISILQPALSNGYYNSPATGIIRLCGTGTSDQTPNEYAFGFTGTTLNTSASFQNPLSTTAGATCSDWTEFFNPNVGSVTGTDFFFFGVDEDCGGAAGTSGCIFARTSNTVPLVQATVAGGTSGIVIDNSSLDGQASNVYFTAQGAGVSTAYKLAQNGLN